MKEYDKNQNRLRIAIQKNGRLHQESFDLLKQCGLKVKTNINSLFYHVENLPIDLFMVRDDDIPTLIFNQVCDLGVVGENILFEKKLEQEKRENKSQYELVQKFNFGYCRLALAVPQDFSYLNRETLNDIRIATSYPYLLEKFLSENNIEAKIIEISGSVEISPRVGLADAICDLVSTGRTLEENFLKEVEVIFQSQAVLIRNNLCFSKEKQEIYEILTGRIYSVTQAQESKYILFHIPKNSLSKISEILPGCESPTIIPLEKDDEKYAVHVVSKEAAFWSTLEKLKACGASSILVLPIEKMLA